MPRVFCHGRRVRSPLVIAATAALLSLSSSGQARSQAPPAPPTPQSPQAPASPSPVASAVDPNDPKPDEGIPITNKVVIEACKECHAVDAKQRLSRISYRRTTPEGWQETIKRMVALNELEIDPAVARQVVKYLSDHLGLAPEEARPASFEVERRMIDYRYEAHAETDRVCSSCHSMGRVLLQRRSKEEWDLLVSMHRGWYPLVDTQVFRRLGPPVREPGPDGRPPDNRHPVDKALDHLKTALPLKTPEWDAWSATMRSPKLEGAWALRGDEPGLGPFFGQLTITASPSSADEFTTAASYEYARGGRTVTRSGRVMIYTGFQWRGRSAIGSDEKTTLREVMLVDRDWRTISGRWFSGGYDELGPDVRLTRIGREPIVLGVDRPSLKKSATGQEVRIFGANFPATLTARDVDFGAGITVARLVRVTPEMVTVQVDVGADAQAGARDLFVAGSIERSATVVFDKVDFIKVTPAWNMARVGGVAFPKMLAQFEAAGFTNGPDGKPDTKDDLNLGRVDATWAIEEYSAATYDDDDRLFVGKIDPATGVFTPADEGPNPARSGNRNNIGDVWVVASHTLVAGAAPLRARAHLLVTVPLYMRWDFFTLGQR